MRDFYVCRSYCGILNRVLPKEIRVIAWAPVRPDFSARFDCLEREYKYFFPRGDLDLHVSDFFKRPLLWAHRNDIYGAKCHVMSKFEN